MVGCCKFEIGASKFEKFIKLLLININIILLIIVKILNVQIT